LGDASVTSDRVQNIFMSIMLISFIAAILYEVFSGYIKYIERQGDLHQGQVEHTALMIH